VESLQKLNHTDEYDRLVALVKELDPGSTPQISWVYRASEPIAKGGKRLGVFSASFNPITVAHVKMIEEARARFGLEEILLLLATANVDKGVFGLSLEERLMMLKAYALTCKDFSVVACSHGRYVDKIEALKEVFPPDTQLSFIVGYDTLVRIFDPKYYTDLHTELKGLFRGCRFIAANRAEHNLHSVKEFLVRPICQPYADYIDLIELSNFYAEVSSTEIRTRILRGENIDHLVPREVQRYLKTTRAYQP
jgi:nicotinate (nicotinamide) nucleotide adenylyltransferase